MQASSNARRGHMKQLPFVLVARDQGKRLFEHSRNDMPGQQTKHAFVCGGDILHAQMHRPYPELCKIETHVCWKLVSC